MGSLLVFTFFFFFLFRALPSTYDLHRLGACSMETVPLLWQSCIPVNVPKHHQPPLFPTEFVGIFLELGRCWRPVGGIAVYFFPFEGLVTKSLAVLDLGWTWGSRRPPILRIHNDSFDARLACPGNDRAKNTGGAGGISSPLGVRPEAGRPPYTAIGP